MQGQLVDLMRGRPLLLTEAFGIGPGEVGLGESARAGAANTAAPPPVPLYQGIFWNYTPEYYANEDAYAYAGAPAGSSITKVMGSSPSTKAVVERLGRARGLPCASDALRAAEAKVSHQVDRAIV
jgi:hypothetical protein